MAVDVGVCVGVGLVWEEREGRALDGGVECEGVEWVGLPGVVEQGG